MKTSTKQLSTTFASTNYPVIYVGLDVHKRSVTAVVLAPSGGTLLEEKLPHDLPKIRQLLDRLARNYNAVVRTAYEAGGCGYGLCRAIRSWKHDCIVVAPSRIPQMPGDKRKTDKRDGLKIARGLRADELQEVALPTPEDEASRDVLRLRMDLKKMKKATQHQIEKLLLRKGVQYDSKQWTKQHLAWLQSVKLPHEAEQYTLATYLTQLTNLTMELTKVEARLQQVSVASRYAERVNELKAFKGVETLTALTLVLELGDFRRFPTAPDLMSFVGLVPSEQSSGDSVRRGKITKTGNSLCRHVLVQAAWQYRRTLSKNSAVLQRRKELPVEVVTHAEKADKRLTKVYRKISERRPSQIAAVAVARELVGFVWGVATRATGNTVGKSLKALKDSPTPPSKAR